MATSMLQAVHQGFNPTRLDVDIALGILMGLRLPANPGGRPDKLPRELVLPILAYAEYMPRTVNSRVQGLEYHANDFPQASVAALCLTTQALPQSFRRGSSITLQMRSADQGWATFGGHGTYNNSHTWFEVCILRPLPGAAAPVPSGLGGAQQQPLELQMPQTFQSPGHANQVLQQLGWDIVNHEGRNTWMVHHNITASSNWANYRVDWLADTPTATGVPGAVGDGEGFLAALKAGDKISLWARAEQRMWVIRVAETLIEVVYDVDI